MHTLHEWQPALIISAQPAQATCQRCTCSVMHGICRSKVPDQRSPGCACEDECCEVRTSQYTATSNAMSVRFVCQHRGTQAHSAPTAGMSDCLMRCCTRESRQRARALQLLDGNSSHELRAAVVQIALFH
jgi:hypothetical protein